MAANVAASVSRERVTAATCSFCGKLQSMVGKVVAGPNGVYICNECIDLCNDIISEQSAEQAVPESPWQPATPPPEPNLAASLKTVRRDLQELTNRVRRLAERVDTEASDTNG